MITGPKSIPQPNIAAINIETVFAEESARHDLDHGYVPFDGIALTDTFQLNESDGAFESGGFFPENSERVRRQKNQDLRVIVMNPPYSGGQTSANDDNQNQKYPTLDASIAATYAKQSTAANKNNLYDSYIRGIRWASNRIKGDGVIAFVSNGSFIDGNTADGMRKTFANEFSRMFIYNLRGNQRTSGETSRREGGKIFGSGSRTQVAIAVLIKNSTHSGPTELRYRDIGDYLTREQKLDVLTIEQSIEGTNWEKLESNNHGDWINHRDERYDGFQPIGDKISKGKPTTTGIFEMYSQGLNTARDSWCYNFSSEKLTKNILQLINSYNQQVTLGITDPEMDPTRYSWNRGTLGSLKRGIHHDVDPSGFRISMYRPFQKTPAYMDKNFNENVYQLRKLFPSPKHRNVSMFMSSPGASKAFSPMVVDCLPNLHLVHTGQAFSLYTYEIIPENELAVSAPGEVIVDGYRRRVNITDTTLTTYRTFYEDADIGKEDIFYYVYGIVHSPAYRKTYKADLQKMLPRIPKVKNFWGFSKAGRGLASLHLNYETVEPYPLEEIATGSVSGTSDEAFEYYRVNKLSFGARKDRSRIIYNSRVTLAGIPSEAFGYQVNGKSALEWILDRYQVTTHKDSQIINDPNDYCREVGDPRYIVDLIKRIVRVSVETNAIVANLPVLEVAE